MVHPGESFSTLAPAFLGKASVSPGPCLRAPLHLRSPDKCLWPGQGMISSPSGRGHGIECLCCEDSSWELVCVLILPVSSPSPPPRYWTQTLKYCRLHPPCPPPCISASRGLRRALKNKREVTSGIPLRESHKHWSLIPFLLPFPLHFHILSQTIDVSHGQQTPVCVTRGEKGTAKCFPAGGVNTAISESGESPSFPAPHTELLSPTVINKTPAGVRNK